MNELKKNLSILFGLLLAVGAPWAMASLFDLSFMLAVPKVFWFALFLSLGLGITWLVQRLRRRMTAKMLMGIVICVTLVLELGFGLVTSVTYLINYHHYTVTSFPWYWGFSFAQYLGGPVVVLCGIAWAVLHIKDDRRNVRDIRLLCLLILICTVPYAVVAVSRRYGLWKVGSIFMYTLLLGLEGGVLWFLKRWEDNLRSGGDYDLPKKEKPLLPPIKSLWRPSDFAIVVLPLVTIGGLMLWFLNTKHIWYNLMTVVGNILAVSLPFVTVAWLTAHHHGTRQKLNHLLLLNGVAIVLTVAAAIIWTVWYNDKEIYPLTRLRADTAIHLGIAYFAPFVLGELLSFLLILRLRKRLHPEKAAFDPLWLSILLVFALFWGVGMIRMVSGITYRQEVESNITEIRVNDQGDHLNLHIHPITYIGCIAFEDGRGRQEGQAYYIDVSAEWSPFLELKPIFQEYGVSIRDEITQIYVQKSPGTYALAAYKDPETGRWLLAGE